MSSAYFLFYVQIRKMSVVSSSNHPTHHNISVGSSTTLGEAVQTSPDSTSHEDIVGDHIGDRDRREDSQDQELDRNNSVPDSQVVEQFLKSNFFFFFWRDLILLFFRDLSLPKGQLKLEDMMGAASAWKVTAVTRDNVTVRHLWFVS